VHVVATAGHVDHGKSTLVRALTGMEPDRFAEERRRGMTIDLGYAWTTVPTAAGEAEIAFVDVPGHQRFIANMLSGIGPAPAVLFVVAADEGWARQSSEHLAAIDALAVRHGLLAVTRSDLADPSSALADAQARIERSSLGAVEAVLVSGATGAGLAELRGALGRLVTGLPVPDLAARVRLWLDRSFSIRGSGTVVTATLSAGTVAVDDELELRGRPVTIRALQVAGAPYDRVPAPARVAVNLRGVPASEVGRGDVLTTPGAWHWTDTVDVSFEARDRVPTELILHVGTAALPVRVRMLGADTARLTTQRPLPLRVGDRGVLRDPGRQSVAAGVLVLDADPPSLARRGAAATRAAALADGAPHLHAEVARRGAVARDHLVRLGVDVTQAADVQIVGDWLVDSATWHSWGGAVPAVLDEWATRHPLDPAPPSAAFRRQLELPDDPQLLAALLDGAGLQIVDGRVVRPGSTGQPDRLPDAVHALVARLQTAPFAAPDRDELRDLGVGRRELAAAARAGVLLALADDIVLLPSSPTAALHLLEGIEAPFTTSEARRALGTTRRVVIPLLEHLDRIGATQRVDDIRRRLT
jgi:selenocysteine-specific elongation factor